MELFEYDPSENSLPYDGTVNYYGAVLNSNTSLDYFNRLLHTIEWRQDEAVIFGKHIVTKRKAAWYGDHPYPYTYSQTTKVALTWTIELLELKSLVEKITGTVFNSCLLNLYSTGEEGMSWHSDNESALGVNTTIASLSLGAARTFLFKHKQTKQKVGLSLAPGSLLVMKGTTQTHWLHSLPKTTKIRTARINLTFRTIKKMQ